MLISTVIAFLVAHLIISAVGTFFVPSHTAAASFRIIQALVFIPKKAGASIEPSAGIPLAYIFSFSVIPVFKNHIKKQLPFYIQSVLKEQFCLLSV